MKDSHALRRGHRPFLVLLAWLAASTRALAQADPLPSWNDGAAKKAIIAFVQATTTTGGPTFVAPEERIATFDQDGARWVKGLEPRLGRRPIQVPVRTGGSHPKFERQGCKERYAHHAAG